MRKIIDVIISYSNRNDTMMLHQGLLKLGVSNVVVPTPNQITSSCGLSIRVKYVDLNKVMYVISRLNLPQSYRLYGEDRSLYRANYINLK